jgi:hypothetical protein
MAIFKTLREKEKALLQDLETVRAAMKLLGGEAGDKPTGRKRRKMSAATRAKMRASAKKRWAAKKNEG